MQNSAITVKQLNMYVKSLLEGDVRLRTVCVTGEISNFKNHYSSGHLYFTLKDNDASIRCVMFRSYASRVNFEIEDGVQVVIKGRVSIYEKDGQYQFYAEEMNAVGLGDISLKFEQIKARLEKEGMFSQENKRTIPKFPKRIAVITSNTGAAVRDILNILERRYPIAEVIMCPVSVQGQLAVPEMLETLDQVYSLSKVDLIIIGRGGGSIEDLWAFNSEELARKIYESPVPVISAVGHETDFTICDFVSDLRAPTPSAAAELAVPDSSDLLSKINKYVTSMKISSLGRCNYYKAKLDAFSASAYFKHPIDAIVYKRGEYFDRLSDRLDASLGDTFDRCENALDKTISKLDALSPLKVIARGFTLTEKNGKAVSSVDDISVGDDIEIVLKDGKALCSVTNKEKNNG